MIYDLQELREPNGLRWPENVSRIPAFFPLPIFLASDLPDFMSPPQVIRFLEDPKPFRVLPQQGEALQKLGRKLQGQEQGP